jgi:hypothetical protein
MLRCEDGGRAGNYTEPSTYIYRTASSSNAEDERMEKRLDNTLNPLNIAPLAPMLRMRGWRKAGDHILTL